MAANHILPFQITAQLRNAKVTPVTTCFRLQTVLSDDESALVVDVSKGIKTDIDEKFRNILGRFRHQVLGSKHEPMELFDALKAWARLCFDPDAGFNDGLRLFLQKDDMDNVGRLELYVLSRKENLQSASWFADYESFTYPGRRFNPRIHKRAACVVLHIPAGIIDWAAGDFGSSITSTRGCSRNSLHLLHILIRECDKVRSRFGVITDGVRIVRVLIGDPSGRRYHNVRFDHVTTVSHSLAQVLAAFIQTYSRKCAQVPFTATRGASLNISYPDNFVFTRFRDFDFYELQRDRGLFLRFLNWKSVASECAVDKGPTPGSSLSIVGSVFPRLLEPWSCPYPKAPLPLDATAIISAWEFRPVQQDISNILADVDNDLGSGLSFQVTKVLQQGNKKFSQVFVGILTDASGFQSLPLCLKLFDERLFPVPTLEQYDEDSFSEPMNRLRNLNFADQMVRREHGVYSYMSELQGTVLPHCYGFFQFEIPNDVRVMGMLTEFVDAVHMDTLFVSHAHSWSAEDRVQLLTRLRYVPRIFNHYNTSQRDWSFGQILCPRRQSAQEDDTSPSAYDICIIDFAFATQFLGAHVLLPTVYDVGELMWILADLPGIDYHLLESMQWAELDECENDR